jgi:hypothetical protein
MNVTEQTTAIAALRDAAVPKDKAEFAASLLNQFDRAGRLSDKQWRWVGILSGNAPTLAGITSGLAPILAMLQVASEKIQRPRLIFRAVVDGRIDIVIKLNTRGRYEGEAHTTDGQPYGFNKYFGRVTKDGAFHPGRDLTPQVRAFLESLAADPAAVAGAYGQQSGECCFCARELTDERSTQVGYGPVCAGNYGLPWGK